MEDYKKPRELKILKFDKEPEGIAYMIPWDGGYIQFMLTVGGVLFARHIPEDGPINLWSKIPLLEILNGECKFDGNKND